MPFNSSSAITLIQSAIRIIISLWWVYAAAVLIALFKFSWMGYVNEKYISGLKWVVLEIQIPKEESLGPKAAEQIFAGLGGTGSKGNFLDKYLKGKVADWFSFEIVGIDGGIHFFIRTIAKNRNLLESLVYSQYPTAIIQEVEDYAKRIPKNTPSKSYDAWGTDMVLAENQAYPIRTYPFFEDAYTKEMVDPLNGFSELFTKLKEGEMLGVQILIRAAALSKGAPDNWKEKAAEEVNKLIGRKSASKKKTGWEDSKARFLWEIKDFASMLAKGLALRDTESKPYPEDKKEEGIGQSLMQHLSPGEREKVSAIEMKASKIGFAARIRILYFAKKDVYNALNGVAAMGMFKQFAVQNLNGFNRDADSITSVDYLLKSFRVAFRKRVLIEKYKDRELSSKTYVLNIEELATLFHFPGIAIKAPMLPRVEAKRAEPPMALPV